MAPATGMHTPACGLRTDRTMQSLFETIDRLEYDLKDTKSEIADKKDAIFVARSRLEKAEQQTRDLERERVGDSEGVHENTQSAAIVCKADFRRNVMPLFQSLLMETVCR